MDAFAGVLGTLLTAHTPTRGGPWSHFGNYANLAKLTGSNAVYLADTNHGTATVYQCAPVTTGADCKVTGRAQFRGTTLGGVALLARIQLDGSCYVAGPFQADGWEIYRRSAADAYTELDFTAADWPAGTDIELEFTAIGNVLTLSADGVVVATATDGAISGAGATGIGIQHNSALGTPTSGPQLAAFTGGAP